MTQLAANKLKSAVERQNVWYVCPEHGTPYEALFDPSYWSHVSVKMKPTDEIKVKAEDGSYSALLEVQDAGKLYAKVTEIWHKKHEAVEVTQGGITVEGYEVKWRGPILRWCVLRGKDCLKDGMEKGAAISWMQSHKAA